MNADPSPAGDRRYGPGEPRKCPTCGRMRLSRAPVCLFCGEPLPRPKKEQAATTEPDPRAVHEAELARKWIAPFYTEFWHFDPGFIPPAKAALEEVTPEVLEELLDIKNWRHQRTAGWFCGLKRWHGFTDTLGSALVAGGFRGLAGEGYCFALARFETDESAQYLATYLRESLIRPEGYHDQWLALPALMWIDHRRDRLDAQEFLAPGGAWETFVRGAGRSDPARECEQCRVGFWRIMERTQEAFDDIRSGVHGVTGPSTTVLPCPNCRRLRGVPTDRGEPVLTCPVCRDRRDRSPGQDDVVIIGEDPSRIRDQERAKALRIQEEFERERAQSRARAARDPQASDLWDEWLDGPRPGGFPR